MTAIDQLFGKDEDKVEYPNVYLQTNLRSEHLASCKHKTKTN